jgi:mevalonate kinase
VGISLKNGAVGAKLTGTGRGGLVIGLAENENAQEKIANAIEKKGYTAWRTTIG